MGAFLFFLHILSVAASPTSSRGWHISSSASETGSFPHQKEEKKNKDDKDITFSKTHQHCKAYNIHCQQLSIFEVFSIFVCLKINTHMVISFTAHKPIWEDLFFPTSQCCAGLCNLN